MSHAECSALSKAKFFKAFVLPAQDRGGFGRVRLQQAEPADIMHQSKSVRSVAGRPESGGDLLCNYGAGRAVPPTLPHKLTALAEEHTHGNGNRERFDPVQAKDGDGMSQHVHPRGEPEKRRICEEQDLRGKCRIALHD